MIDQDLSVRLVAHPQRLELLHHGFFAAVRERRLGIEQVGTILGQWWHPLHCFPRFLSRCVAAVPSLEIKSAVSQILFQELGEGVPERAHENIYVSTMTSVGFDRAVIAESAPFESTRRLVAGYENAVSDWPIAIGCL